MILIADGGSTKCDWILLDESGNKVFKTRTQGLNPAVFSSHVLEKRLTSNSILCEYREQIKKVNFYGAGCGTERPCTILHKIFQDFFTFATINIDEDMMAAVLATTDRPGIVCILGTGSNVCYFNNGKIKMAVPSLGFILMDEASGNYFGKRLIQDYYYNRMPIDIRNSFENTYNLDADEIKHNIYQRENPNAYLAHFAEFIFSENQDLHNHYFRQLLTSGLREFIEARVLCFEECKIVPIHFVGSISHFSQEIIKEVLMEYNLELGNIVRRPMEGLIEHYKKNISEYLRQP